MSVVSSSTSNAGTCFRIALLAGSSALLLVAVLSAGNQSLGATSGARPVVQLQNFNIPPEPLSRALAAYGTQTGIQIAFDSATVSGVRSSAVVGQMTKEQALSQMLAGTNVVWRKTGGYSVSLEKASSNMMLGPVRVDGKAPDPARHSRAAGEVATGPVHGYVAHLSNTGTKTDTPLVETAQSISVLPVDFIRDIGAQTVGQALAYTSGVQMQPYGFDPRYDQVLLRGFSASAYGNYRDGMRFANGSFAQFRNDPYEAERIEVFRGPTSVLYGGNQPGGMVNVVSKLPTADSTREVGLTLGNWNRYQGEFDLGGSLDDAGKFTGRLVGLVRDSDTRVSQTKDNRITVSPSVTIRLGERTVITLFANYQNNLNSMWPYYYRSSSGLTHVKLGDPAFDALRQQQYYFGYKLEHRINEMITLRQNFRYGRVYYDGEFTDLGAQLSTTTIGLYTGRWQERLKGTNLDNQAQFSFRTGPLHHVFLFGVDYFRQRLDSEYSEGNDSLSTLLTRNLLVPDYGHIQVGNLTTYTHTFQKIDQTGIYGQEQLSWNRVRLLLGGREDIVATSSRNQLTGVMTTNNPRAFTGRASLLYLFDSGIAPYFSYSTSFLPTSGTSSPARGSKAFSPTRGHQYELGVKYQPHDFDGYVSADIYDLHQTNVVTTDPSNESYNVQTGEVRSRGAEVEGSLSLGNGLNVRGQYSYVDVKNIKSNTAQGKTPVAVPRNTASLFLIYTLQKGALKGLVAGGGVRFSDKSWADVANTYHNDSLTAFDINLRKTIGLVDAQLNVNNIANRRIAVCNTGSCTWSMGRIILGTLRVRW